MANQIKVSSTGVNLRKSASTTSAKYGYISPSTTLNYTGTTKAGGYTWYQVKYNGNTGWVCGYNVKPVSGSSTNTANTNTASTQGSVKVSSSGVNLRKSSSISSAKLGFVPASTTLSYTATTTAGGYTWYQVKYNGNTGWVCGANVTKVSSSASNTSKNSSSSSSSSTSASKGKVQVKSGGVNFRSSSSTSSSKLGFIAAGTVLEYSATASSGGYTWYQVKNGGKTGWVCGANVSKYTGSSSAGSSSAKANSKGYVWPSTATYVSSPFGYRSSFKCTNGNYTNSFHSGIDIAGGGSATIYATKGGTVYSSCYYDSACGNFVKINHGDGTYSRYYHMSAYYVSNGTKVSAGQKIGHEGSTGNVTGPHLHFEIRIGGDSTSCCVDPQKYAK